MSSSIPSWQTLTAHAQPFRGARDLAFCLKVPLDSLLVWASSEGSGETARMRRLAWTFAARIGDKYQIRLARPIWHWHFNMLRCTIMSSMRFSASAQSDQSSLPWALSYPLSAMRMLWSDWSDAQADLFLLGTHTILLVLSCCSSYIERVVEPAPNARKVPKSLNQTFSSEMR